MQEGDVEAWRKYYQYRALHPGGMSGGGGEGGAGVNSTVVVDLTDIGLDASYSIWGLFYLAAMSVGTVAFHLPFLHTMCCHVLELLIYIIFCAVAYVSK